MPRPKLNGSGAGERRPSLFEFPSPRPSPPSFLAGRGRRPTRSRSTPGSWEGHLDFSDFAGNCFGWLLDVRFARFQFTVACPPRPDVETALAERRNLPGAPNAPVLAEAVIDDIVRTGICFRPPAFTAGGVITTLDQEQADVVGAIAGHAAVV